MYYFNSMWNDQLVDKHKRRLLYRFNKLNTDLQLTLPTVSLLLLGRTVDFFLEVLET